MDLEELICSVCNQYFDNEDRLPRMIPACGHTFCTKCIREIIQISSKDSEPKFCCPEDGAQIDLNSPDINLFPKNFLLVRLVEKRKSLLIKSPERKNTNEESLSIPSLGVVDQRDPFLNMLSTTNSNDIEDDSCPQSYRTSNSYSSRANVLLCLEHGRPFEIICLDDRCRICSSCALFGSHRNHNIKPEGEVLKDIASRAEHLIDIFQMIQKQEGAIAEDEKADVLQKKLKEKQDDLTQKVKAKFEEYINNLRSQERKLVEDIEARFQGIKDKVYKATEIPRDMYEMIQKWKASADDMLTIMSDKSERGEIAFEFIPDKYNKNDLLAVGERLSQELARFKDNSLLGFEAEANKVSVNFSQSFPKLITSVACLVDSDEDSFPSTDVTNVTPRTSLHGHSLSHHSMTPIKRGDVQLLINSEPAINYYESGKVQQKLNSSSSQDYNNTLKKNLLSPDISRQNISMRDKENVQRSLNPRFAYQEKRGFSLRSDEEEDVDLLSFELRDLGLGEVIATDPTPVSRRDPLKNLQHQDSRSPRNLSPYNGSRNGVEDFYGTVENRSNRSSQVLIIPNNQGQQQQRQHKTFIKLDSYNNSRDVSRSISPIRGDTSASTTPTNRSKQLRKKNLQVADKYEGVIEGIKDNSIEGADLTGADLGDQGIYHLADYIKYNTRLKSLKLVKNKISDEGGIALVNALLYNRTLHTLNLTQNLFTEKTVDAFLELFRSQKTLRTIYFNQNSISLRNIKNKVKEMTLLGVNVSI